MMIALILDTETTGLIDNRLTKLDKQPHIIEFYGCLSDLKTGKIMCEIEHLIKPPVSISEEVVKITGIDDEMVSKAQPFEAIASQVETLISNSPMVIAHNMSYDKDMIEIEFERLGKKIKWPELMCTVEQTIHLCGYRLNLSALYEHLFKTSFKGTHRAKNDVQALLACCVELTQRGELLGGSA